MLIRLHFFFSNITIIIIIYSIYVKLHLFSPSQHLSGPQYRDSAFGGLEKKSDRRGEKANLIHE